MTDVKLKIGDERVYYPDVMVTCDPTDNNELYVLRPCVPIEVLSPATQRTDRTEKLEKYLEIPSLRLYRTGVRSRPTSA
ncbi:Uma2 family endonuclease [Meiothermus sp. PNK-Is4]|uniref:Uma2 family endonuclease n=1 Tax=Meiothermus sp. PNK-Is4 TaxID=2740565 RepID=UPI00352B228C